MTEIVTRAPSIGNGGHRVNEPCRCESCAAFHAAGIELDDLKLFVEAVRRTWEAQVYVLLKKPGAEAVAHEAYLKMQTAAARLPENRNP